MSHGEDKLESYWYVIIWCSLLVPCFGGWIIIIVSSVMYYAWRKNYPKKAQSINRHGWAAWLLGMLIALGLRSTILPNYGW